MIILWTQHSAWSSYHSQPSWVFNLGSAKLCSVHNVALVSTPLFFNVCKGKGSKKTRQERQRGRGKGRVRGDLCTFAHLSLGIVYQPEKRQVRRRVSILGTQWTTLKGFISSYLLPTPFQGNAHSSPFLFLTPANIVISDGKEHVLFVKLPCGGSGQLEGLRMPPFNAGFVQNHATVGDTSQCCIVVMAAYQTWK